MIHLLEGTELQEKLEKAFDTAKDELENRAEAYEATVESIPHKAYDGFYPHTNGGLSIMIPCYLDYVWGSGYTFGNEAIQKQIQEDIDNSLEMALDDFITENAEELKPILERIPEISYHSLYEEGESELAEALSEKETSYLSEGSDFWLCLKVQYYEKDNHRNESGEDEAYFLAGVNLDYTYGRDKGLEITAERNIPISELQNLDLDELITELIKDI